MRGGGALRAVDEHPEIKRIKVLLFITSTAGGAGVHAYYLAKYLSREQFDITVAFGPGYPLDAEFRELDVPVKVLRISRRISPLTNLRGLQQVHGLIKRKRFDIVCMECSIAGFIGRIAASLAGVPVKVLIIQAYASRPFQNPLRRSLFRWIERALDPLTTRYVAVSQATKRCGVETGIMPPEKVDVIYNAVDLKDKIRIPPDKLPEDLRRNRHIRVVGTLSRCEPQKGLGHLLRAAAIVRERNRDTEFWIVGDGPARRQLEALARQLAVDDVVRFRGWRSDIGNVLSALDVFCLPSLWEQAPLALAEAMAMGLPVVATAVDGVPEMVNAGKTGILVPPKDPHALAAAICRLLDDPALAERMGKAGRERAEQMLALETMVSRYEDFLRNLVIPPPEPG
jgi:glycosyltransferase involved in cell wall biosynthesis